MYILMFFILNLQHTIGNNIAIPSNAKIKTVGVGMEAMPSNAWYNRR